MKMKRWLSTLASLVVAGSTVAGCRWIVPPNRQESPPRALPGAGPLGAHGAPDDSFTVFDYEGLRQYRSKGTIRVPIAITRFYGPTTEDGRLLHPEQVEAAYLTVRLWDVDADVTDRHRLPEAIQVRLNGQPLHPEITGLNNQWTTFTLPLPAEALRFPSSHSPVIPAQNWIEFNLDVRNEEPGWQVWIDWVQLTVTGARPWVLVHGFLSDETTWRYWTNEYAPARGIPVHAFSLADNAGSMWLHGLEIAAEVAQVQRSFGVQQVHLVGSSKGGPDGRVAIAVAGEAVDRFVMIGAPHHGSELADLVKIGAILYPWLGPVIWIGEPALTELTTWYARLASDRIPRSDDTTYATIASVWLGGINPLLPGPDDGVVSTASAEALPYAPSLGRPHGFHLDNPRNEQIFALTYDHLAGAGSSSMRQDAAPPVAAEAPQLSAIVQAKMAAYEARSWELPIEAGRPATFALLWRGGTEPSITLRSPSGEPVATTAVRSEEPTALPYHLIQINEPEGGLWQVSIENGAEESLVLLATAVDSPLRLAATVLPPSPAATGMITAEVSLAEGRAPSRLRAWIAYPQGRVEEVALLSNGRPTATGNLLFSAPYLPPTDAYGDIPIVIAAEMEGASRYLLTGVTIPHPTARLTWEALRAADGALEATAKLEGFPAGPYQILTSLTSDKEGSFLAGHALVQAASESEETTFRWELPAGATNLSLGALYAFDSSGRLITAGEPRAVPAEVVTSAPQRLQIERIEAPVGTARSIAVPVTFAAPQAGRMVLNARLTDGKGRLIGWASVAGKARAGRQTWYLRFPATEQGPLYLWDLSLYVEGRPEQAILIPLTQVQS